ncbi:MAG TPA: ABC transporter ATP-binding protein [Bacillota bacterium]|nr:ABC transporter ATP-binding protein [Bacillota bacterium]
MIEFIDVHKTYPDGTEALKGLSLRVTEGEFVTLIGPSGCGKTTTMKMVNRLIEPTSGYILINGEKIDNFNIHELRWNIGYVLQDIALFPHLTIEENIHVVPEMKKWKRKKMRERSHELLDMVGLDPSTYKKRMPSELSGGEQQRIGVIRALAADPDIILMDEPFSALDPISREQLQHDIQLLQKEIKKTILFVTHDIDEAMALGDRICLMNNGKIIQTDTPQQMILHPKTSFVKDFIGERKSPWQTAVDVICDRESPHMLSLEKIHEAGYPEQGIYFIHDNHYSFIGTVHNGEKVKVKTLPNNLPLYEATNMMENNEQTLYPVVKDTTLIGTLNYKDIVSFLQSKSKLENGVMPS